MKLTMPDRRMIDGAVEVLAIDDDEILIAVTTNGDRQHMRIGRFNAWRVFGTLSVILGIPLPPATGKAIKL